MSFPANGSASANDPPVAEAGDYIGIAVLAAMLCIGGPLNALSLLRSLGVDVKAAFGRFCCRRTTPVAERRRTRRFALTLNFHLTVANLLIIWVFVLSEVCWRVTYQWLGGDILCRLVRFVHAFCFYATSNLVSTIALDRLYMAIRIDRPGGAAARANAVRWFANCAWTLALICSLPQLYVWRTLEPFPGWQQCVTIFDAVRHEQSTAFENATDSRPEDKIESKLRQDIIDEANYLEKLYNGLHLAFVFWLPVLLIIICYALIVTRFHRDIRKSKKRYHFETASMGDLEISTNGAPALTNSPLLKRSKSRNSQNPKKISNNRSSTMIDFNSESAAVSPQHRSIDFRFCFPLKNARDRLGTRNRNRRQIAGGGGGASSQTADIDRSTSMPTNLLSAAMIAGQPLLPNNFAASTLMRAKRRTVRKSVWILLAYFICWSPYNVLSLWRFLDPTFVPSLLTILYDLIVLNAVVNPLIYGI